MEYVNISSVSQMWQNEPTKHAKQRVDIFKSNCLAAVITMVRTLHRTDTFTYSIIRNYELYECGMMLGSSNRPSYDGHELAVLIL